MDILRSSLTTGLSVLTLTRGDQDSLAGLTCLEMAVSSNPTLDNHTQSQEFLRADNIKATPPPPPESTISGVLKHKCAMVELARQASPIACELRAPGPPCICTQLKREQQSRQSPGRLSTSGQINEKPPCRTSPQRYSTFSPTFPAMCVCVLSPHNGG
jgi:hypothetical protein